MAFWFWSLILPLVVMVLALIYSVYNLNSGALYDNWAWIVLMMCTFIPFLCWPTCIFWFIRFADKVYDDNKYHNLFKDTKLNRFLFQSHFN